MSFIGIPEKARRVFEWLAGAGDSRQRIQKALADAGPVPRLEQLAQNVADSSEVDIKWVTKLLQEFAVLHEFRVREQMSTEDLAGDVVEAMVADGIITDDDPDQRHELLEFLSRALQEQSLGVAARALSIQKSGEKVYCKARTITDLRPVFPVKIEDGASAAVVAHSLEIVYHEGVNWNRRLFCVNMRKSDLEGLREAIDRALEKDQSLTKMAALLDLPILEHQSD